MHKGTVKLYNYLDSTLPQSVFRDELWKCFYNDEGNPSKKRMNRLFEDNGRDDIRHCKPDEVVALARLLDLDPWELINTYGMGEIGINLKEGNRILQLTGHTLGPVAHVA